MESAMERKAAMEELSRTLRRFLSASDAFDEAIGQMLGLNATDFRCVDLLDQHGTMTAGVLAELAGLSSGAATFMLDRLENAGFVRRVRDPLDRRRVLVELVPEAQERLYELHTPLIEAWRAAAKRFAVAELVAVTAFLEEGRALYERQIPLLRSKAIENGSPAAAGRAFVKAAVKAQAKAEAMEKLELTARKLQEKATKLRDKALGG
jgi:DNA-binding MarR family transcriptional regulator